MPSDRINQTPEEQGFPVSVILEYHRPSKHSREAAAGTVVGIVAMGSEGEGAIHARLIRSGESGDQYLWTGFSVNLHVDDAESYYCNLMGEKPSAFVISRPNAEGRLEPFLITLSYDEATSHIEVDDRVEDRFPNHPEKYVVFGNSDIILPLIQPKPCDHDSPSGNYEQIVVVVTAA